MNLKLSQEQRKKLADRLCQEIEASESAKGSLPDRWQLNRALYNNEEGTSTLNVIDGVEPYSLPLYRSKADRLTDHVVKTFTALTPYVQVLVEDLDSMNSMNDNRYEMALMCLAEYSGFKRTFKRAFVESMNTNLGVMRLRPVVEDGVVTGIYSERIKPEHMVGYPTYVSTLEECTTVGHKFLLGKREVQARIDSKVYYDEDYVATSSTEEFEKANVTYTLTSTDNTAVTEEAYDLTPVKLYEVITTEKIGGEWKKVLCVVAYDTRVVLSCQEYPYPAHWYIEMRIDDEDDTLWPNNSLAQRVQGLNMAFSDGNSAMFIGSLATAFPMLAVNGSITGNKYKKWTPAMILELPHGVEAKVLGTSFNPGALPLALQKIEEMADAVVGISRLGTGQALPADTREAAINGILQAQSEAKESYADACSSAVKKYFQLLDTYLIAHFDELKQVYGTKIPIDDLSELPEEYKLEVTGQNSGASPQVLMQKLQMLMGMSAQPASVFSPRKVEERIGQAMELPFDVSGLRKDEIDQLLQTIALLDQQGFPGAELAMQGLMVMAQNAINATQGGVGVEQPGGAGDTGGTPQEATGAEGQL